MKNEPTRKQLGLLGQAKEFGQSYTPKSFTMNDFERVSKEMEKPQAGTSFNFYTTQDQYLAMFGTPEEKEAAIARIEAKLLSWKLQEIESYREKLSPDVFRAYLWLEEKYGRNRDAKWTIQTLLAPPPRDNDYMYPENPEVIMKGNSFKIKAGFGDGYNWEDVVYFESLTAEQLPLAIKRLKKIKGFKTVRK
jgi:hypothetical protein